MHARPRPATLMCLLVPITLTAPAAAGDLAAPAAALGVAELEQLALHHNPTLTQAAAAVEASRGKAYQAGLCLNPTVGYIGELMNTSGTAGELQGGFVEQTIVTAGKQRLSRAKYTQEAFEAEQRALAQRLRVLNGVRTRFFEVLAEQRLVGLRQGLLRNAEESLRTHREMFNNGQANRPDLLLSEVEVSRARIALVGEENRLRAGWASLAAVVGKPDLCPAPLAGELEPTGPPLDWECSLKRLLEESPEVLAAQAHVTRDQIALTRERREPYPNVTLGGATGYNYETSNPVASAYVNVRIPLWDRNQGTIRQAQADLTRSVAEVHRVELSLRQRLAGVFNQYLTAFETVWLYREVNLPRLAEAFEVKRDMYQKRRAPWMSAVRAERDLLTAKAEYTGHLNELRRAEVAVAGLLLVDGLTEPVLPASGGHLDATPKPR